MEDGKCRNAIEDFVAYAEEKSCSAILMEVIPIFIAERLDEDAVRNLLEQGIYSVYCQNGVIKYFDKAIQFTTLYEEEEMKYSTLLVE